MNIKKQDSIKYDVLQLIENGIDQTAALFAENANAQDLVEKAVYEFWRTSHLDITSPNELTITGGDGSTVRITVTVEEKVRDEKIATPANSWHRS